MVKRDYYDPGKPHSRRFDDSTGGNVAPTIPQKVDTLILPFLMNLCKEMVLVKLSPTKRPSEIAV